MQQRPLNTLPSQPRPHAVIAAAALSLIMAACGGGGGDAPPQAAAAVTPTGAPVVTSDLLLTRNGFRVIGSGALARVIGSRSRCSPTVFLDGQALVGFNINDITPSTIKLLVTYPGFASLPIGMQSARGDPSCGAIAIISQQ